MSELLASPLVETAIGIVLVWFISSTICTGIVETVGSVLGTKAKMLWRFLGNVLNTRDAPGGAGIPAADALRMAAKPTLLGEPIKVFADTIPGVNSEKLDDASRRVKSIDPTSAVAGLLAAIDADENNDTALGKLIAKLPAAIKDTPDKLQSWVEKWFDSQMNELSTRYRRNIRYYAAVAGAIVVCACGVDSIAIVNQLWHDPAKRELLLAEAKRVVTTNSTGDLCASPTPSPKPGETPVPTPPVRTTAPTATPRAQGNTPAAAPTSSPSPSPTVSERIECASQVADQLAQLKISIWQHTPTTARGWAVTTLGMLISWVATLAGAPFWFDVLKRAMGLRSPAKT